LAAATEQALRSAGIATTAKHAPGHGRATSDSHFQLPVVEAPLADLLSDLAPFIAVKEAPFFMTAHIVYRHLDPDLPATCSRKCLDWLRSETGFTGVILSDDLAMKALTGPIRERAAAAISAGCDALLYCPGDLRGNVAAIEGAGPAGDRLEKTWQNWSSSRRMTFDDDAFLLAAELWAVLDEIGLQ
jgi:beta-N-acetylhexosaminidase